VKEENSFTRAVPIAKIKHAYHALLSIRVEGVGADSVQSRATRLHSKLLDAGCKQQHCLSWKQTAAAAALPQQQQQQGD
jgi:hypothetical protein